ncbi:MAG: 2-methyl-6-phytyl-1,4-hydroquinone methyltransferase [Chloroflexi bacterium]|nr:2-methyl-6-phytyl-1,4-hydroquinone methyltransferase [Chloroflexota bacterium]
MKPKIAKLLITLNHQFYQKFSQEFSDTRLRLQPGVQKILKTLPSNTRLLDLGCGNGELARVLARDVYRGSYVGTDFSPNLLETARQDLPEDFSAQFYPLDLTTPDWQEHLPPLQFDFIFCFATLHHIPSREIRIKILENVRFRLKSGGKFIHSNWQFLNSERLKKRVQPWEKVDLSPHDVDEGDYLLDWRRGGYGLRYVHHFSPTELRSLAQETGFSVEESFFSDGKEGNLGLYQVWGGS